MTFVFWRTFGVTGKKSGTESAGWGMKRNAATGNLARILFCASLTPQHSSNGSSLWIIRQTCFDTWHSTVTIRGNRRIPRAQYIACKISDRVSTGDTLDLQGLQSLLCSGIGINVQVMTLLSGFIVPSPWHNSWVAVWSQAPIERSISMLYLSGDWCLCCLF